MTTVLDLANFAMMQMDGGGFGGEQLLSAASVQAMQTLAAPHYTVAGEGYGITFKIGAPPGIHMKIINDAFDQVLGLPADVQATPQPLAIQPDRSAWPGFAGLYVSHLWGLLTVSPGDDGLVLDMAGKHIPLKAHSPEIYFGPRPGGGGIYSVGFVPPASGAPCRHLMVDSWTATRFEPDPAFVPDRALLEQHAGSYRSPANGQEDIRLWVGEDGRLWARFTWCPDQEFPCTPLNSNERFASGGGIFIVAEGALLINGWRLPKAAQAPR
jgi:hypothetical protein